MPPQAVDELCIDPQACRKLYDLMQTCEREVGGGEGGEGLYGSITRTGTQRVLRAMVEHTGLAPSSVLIDVGAGLARPLMHALLYPGVSSTYGVELDYLKCQKASVFVARTLARAHRRALLPSVSEAPRIACCGIEAVGDLQHATHAYSFWEGVPLAGKQALGRLFASAPSMQGVAVVQRAMRGSAPAAYMASLGFGAVSLADKFGVSMSGSGRSFTAYVFRKGGLPQDWTQDSHLRSTCPTACTATGTSATGGRDNFQSHAAAASLSGAVAALHPPCSPSSGRARVPALDALLVPAHVEGRACAFDAPTDATGNRRSCRILRQSCVDDLVSGVRRRVGSGGSGETLPGECTDFGLGDELDLSQPAVLDSSPDRTVGPGGKRKTAGDTPEWFPTQTKRSKTIRRRRGVAVLGGLESHAELDGAAQGVRLVD